MGHLNMDKELSKSIADILVNDFRFNNDLSYLIMANIGYLISYNILMVIIEAIGKNAVKNAVDKATCRMLDSKLDNITNFEYEKKINSIIHHSNNLLACIRNLFIEFPRKAIACHHYMIALQELSFEIMIYCTVVSLIFSLISVYVSYFREKIAEKITEYNTEFSLISSDVSNSIQSYKIDDRLNEYKGKFNKTEERIRNESCKDSLMIGIGDVSSGISSQFMIGLISYMSREMFVNEIIQLKDLLYGINSSSKFVEKLVGVVDYFGDVIKQYQSFYFFLSINNIAVNFPSNNISIDHFEITTPTYNYSFNIKEKSNIIRFMGKNGVGKTTILLKMLGVSYKGAKSNGVIIPYSSDLVSLVPENYRNSFSFVQQAVPITHDTVGDYIMAVSGSNNNPLEIISTTLNYFGIEKDDISSFMNEININKNMREISGGQGKLIQILSAISKCYHQSLNLIVMDEPSNNLDISKVNLLISIITSIKSKGVTIFLVTHDERLTFPDTINIQL